MSSRRAQPAEPPRILVVEDDPTIADLVTYNLERAGYRVQQERAGRPGLEAALAGAADLVLLDLMLPGLDGLTVAREIKRRKPHLPIIMLTARAERETVLEGFEAGADDYVTKPFDMDVLLARIQARLRTTPEVAAPTTTPTLRVLGNLTLDRDARALRTSSRAVRLKPKEFALLDLLASRPEHLFSREELTEAVWRQRYIAGSRSLDVHVRRLRGKLEELDADLQIETIRGAGYRALVGGVGARPGADDLGKPGAADFNDPTDDEAGS
jgi:DNA-binding response OmpR family regulator